MTNEADSQSAQPANDFEHSVDEAQTGSSQAKDRDSHPEGVAAGAERARLTTQPGMAPAHGADHADNANNDSQVAAGEDESAVSSGTDEAAEIDAAARGVAQNTEDLPNAAEAAELDAAVRGEALSAVAPAAPENRAEREECEEPQLSEPSAQAVPVAQEPLPAAPAIESAQQPLAAAHDELAPDEEPPAAEPVIDATPREEPLAAAPAPAARRRRELDFEEAERFAANIRPSWADAPPISAPPPNAIGAVDGAARVIRSNTRTDLTTPLRKRRGSAYAILAASLLGVAGLLYLGISSSTVDHSRRGLSAKDHESGPHVLKPAPEPVETAIQPAQTPEPTPPEQPQLAAAQPSEPAAPEPSVAPEVAPPANTAEPGTDTPELKEPSFAGEQPQAEPAAVAAPEIAAPANEPAAPQLAAAPEQPASEPQPATPAAEQAPAPQPAAALAAAPRAPAEADEKIPQPSAAAPPALKPLPAGPNDRSKVELSLAAYPPNTKLRVDGVAVENPYRAKLPKSSKHRIDAAAPGYSPESHVMRMEADVQLMISLKREQARDVKADPYAAQQRRSTTAAAQVAPPAGPKRDRGAGFVAENPY